MKRLKEDLGITLERTGEWDYWTDNEGQEIHFKLKNPPKNKFIDLDTFVIYCELRREGAEMPTYQVKFRLPFSKLEGGERYLYYSDMQLIGGNTYQRHLTITVQLVTEDIGDNNDLRGKIVQHKLQSSLIALNDSACLLGDTAPFCV